MTRASIRPVMTTAALLLAASMVGPATVRAQDRLTFEGYVVGVPTKARSALATGTERISGTTLGAEGSAAWHHIALRLGYTQGSLNGSGLPSRDQIDGFVFVGIAPIPELAVLIGPHARALVVSSQTERWLSWEIRGRGVAPMVKPWLSGYGELWTSVGGDVNTPEGFGTTRGGTAGLLVRLAQGISFRVGYSIDEAHTAGGFRRETVEGLTLGMGITR